MSDKEQMPEYEVGYRKPPKRTQFQPGQSGNKMGRPKGAKNLATIVGNAITERVMVNENGKRQSISKLEVAVKQLVNKAAAGDLRSMMQLLPLVQLVEGRAEAAAASTPSVVEADRTMMSSIAERFRRRIVEETTTQPTDTDQEPNNG